MRRGDDPGPEPDGDDLSGEATREDRNHLDALSRARRRRAGRLVLLLVVVLILVVFIIQNSQRVPIDFVFFDRQARLIWIMLACAVLGGIVGFLVGRPGRRFRFHSEREGKDREERKRDGPERG
jgi:uncharacterized integral membrane protein